MDTVSRRSRNRLAVVSSCARSDRTGHGKFFEPLENRVLLHAAVNHVLPPELARLANEDGHVPADRLVAAMPELAGRNLWDPATFNPTGSEDPKNWLYDPHFIEGDAVSQDDFPVPAAAAGGGAGGADGAIALPDLVPLTSGVGYNYLVPFLDQSEIPGRNLLRFTTGIGNLGSGPAILRSAQSGTPPVGSGISSWINPDGTQNVLQQMYSFNGTAFIFDSFRQAGRMVWHNGHGHFHLEGYAEYKLRANVGGSPGAVATRSDGTPAVGEKVGFCLINVATSFTLPGGASSTTLPNYGAAGQPGTSCGFTQGIHVGNRDVYSAQYDGQWIDVTGVANGNYFLEVTFDALNVIEESNEANNTVLVPVSLNANPPAGGIQPDRFEPNNDFAGATDLGVQGHQTESGLTIHTSSENDFFRFTAASTGNYQVRLNVGDRDVNLFVYDSNQVLLASSTSAQLGPMTEQVSVNFVAGQTYYVRAQGFGSDLNPVTSAVSSNYALQVMINPTVNAGAPDPVANELGGNSGLITLARNGPTGTPLSVNIDVSGTATRGVDYEIYQDGVLITGNTVSIGTMAANAPLEIRPLEDNDIDPNESVTITLSNSAAYVIGSPINATVTIADSGPQVQQTQQVWQTSPHRLMFTFSRDVGPSLSSADFQVIDLGNSQTVPATLSYNTATRVATLTFSGVLPDGQYRATVLGAGVLDAVGQPMQSDVQFDFFTFAGDANHDGTINLADFNVLAENFGQSGRDASTGDFNYDGIVNLADFNILAQKFGTSVDGTGTRTAPPSVPRFGGTGGPLTKGGGLFGDGRAGGEDDQRDDLLA